MLKIAFYKGTKTGVAGIYNRGVRWMEKGLYSHCEVIFSDGISASSSFMDGGVRFKNIEYTLDKWDIFELPWADEKKAREYFESRKGMRYNVKGNIHFIFGFIRGDSDGEFCSEACAGALGLQSPWLVAPNALAHFVVLINERFSMFTMSDPTNPYDPSNDNPPEDTGGDTLPPKKEG